MFRVCTRTTTNFLFPTQNQNTKIIHSFFWLWNGLSTENKDVPTVPAMAGGLNNIYTFKMIHLLVILLYVFIIFFINNFIIKLMKGKALRKHSLHGENSLGFIILKLLMFMTCACLTSQTFNSIKLKSRISVKHHIA